MNYPRTHYTRGDTYPVFWNVAKTDRAPIYCASVNIWLSVDGGQNFKYPVASNIPNTGEALITIPADAAISTAGRFKIKCSGNIFFAVSYRNFFVTEFDDSITIRYNNEDQAEANLKDLPLNSEPTVSNSIVDNTFNSGGGIFDLLICLFLLVFIKEQYNYHKLKNNNSLKD